MHDCPVFAATEEQCRHRQRMLTVALRVLGKEVSSKIDRTIRRSGKIAGMKFTKGGVVETRGHSRQMRARIASGL